MTRRSHVYFMPGIATLALVAGIGLAHCKGVDPVIASGESVNALGETFVTTADGMNRLYDLKVIGPAQYAEWRQFGRTFQATYPLAVSLWHAAVEHQDGSTLDKVVSILTELGAKLGVWVATVQALMIVPADGGAP